MTLVGLVMFVIGSMMIVEVRKMQQFLPVRLAQTFMTLGFILVITAFLLWMYA